MEQHKASAGLLLSCGLFALALPATRPEPRPCEHPSEVAVVEGYTTAVRCVADPADVLTLRGPARQLFGLPIDLNCARAATLESFPGIGPVRARAIIEERQIRRFERVDDLTRVHGIGPKTLARLRPAVSVTPLPLTEAGMSTSVESAGCRSDGIRGGRDASEERR